MSMEARTSETSLQDNKMTWVEAVSSCFKKCCGEGGELDTLANDHNPSFQSTYTIRRISSFGQTIVDEDGEEKEIERHSSIIKYDGGSVPWTSKPAPVQPGVTHLDVKNQLEKLPTITEVPLKTKQKRRWKKTGRTDNRELFQSTPKKDKATEEIQLKSIKYKEYHVTELNEPTDRLDGTRELTISTENLFPKCKKSIADDSLQKFQLSIPNIQIKSASTPNLVNCEKMPDPVIKSSLSKDSWPKYTIKSSSQHNLSQKKESESDSEKLAKQYGLDLSMYTEEALKAQNISLKSILSHQTKNWIEGPVATLLLSLQFNNLQRILNVTLNAIETSGGDILNDISSIIIKLTLIGSKKIVKTTKRIEEHLKSSIDQNIDFLLKDMDFREMRVTLHSSEWLGKHDALGYGVWNNSYWLDKVLEMNLKLYRQPNYGKKVGSMQVSCSFDGTMLHINAEKIFNTEIKARNVKMYSKIALYRLSTKVKERIQQIDDANIGENEICINHSSSFKIDGTGTKKEYIIITLKTKDNQGIFKTEKSLGRLKFGPTFHYEGHQKMTPWGEAIINKKEIHYNFEMYSGY